MAGDEHGFIFMYYVRVLGELFWGACVDYVCFVRRWPMRRIVVLRFRS